MDRTHLSSFWTEGHAVQCVCGPTLRRPAHRSASCSAPCVLCVPSGLTPPTTPPHKPAEDELFKPTEGGKGSEDTGEGRGGEGVAPASNAGLTKGSSWLSRSHHQRKVPEQTELYAQLLRTGQAGHAHAHAHGHAHAPRHFGDHDYCALSLGEKRKRSAAMLGAMLQAQGGGGASTPPPKADDLLMHGKVEEDEEQLVRSPGGEPTGKGAMLASSSPPDRQMVAATPPSSEEEAERSSRSPSPIRHHCPESRASKTDSR